MVYFDVSNVVYKIDVNNIRKILVTGVGGFIGFHLSKKLLELGLSSKYLELII